VVLLGVLVWRERRAAALTRAADQFAAIVREGRFTDRVHTGSIAGRLADNANRLLEQMAMRDLMINERERSLVGLLGGLHEAVAVHREHVVFANDRFAALVGSNDARRLEGKSLPEFVHPDYTELVREHLRRSLARRSGAALPDDPVEGDRRTARPDDLARRRRGALGRADRHAAALAKR
jgi:PAS domain-containing protein